ncbi:MAG: CoA transferase [Chloroflexi bacterium]|nr:CoA transferase [Chloroflexota bacterium]
MQTGALEGVRVIEWAEGIAGPFAGRILAGLGAEVVKVEPPGGGDASRRAGPFRGDVPDREASGLFLYLNAGKRGITLDPARPGGREVFGKLLAGADVLVLDKPAPALRRWRLGLPGLQRRHPGLVVASVTPFGLEGPYAGFKASDLVTFHMAGLGFITPRLPPSPDLPPLRAGTPIVGYLAGLNGAAAIGCALLVRELSGRGQLIDLAEMECAMFAVAAGVPAYTYEPRVPSRQPAGPPAVAPIALLPTADGYFEVQCQEEEHWDGLVGALGEPEWARWEVFADKGLRGQNWDALRPLLEEVTRTVEKARLFREAQARGVPLAPVNSPRDVVECEHLRVRGFFETVEHPVAGPVLMPGALAQLTATPWRALGPAPLLGQHTTEVLEGLGYSKAELLALRQRGAV